MLPARTQSHPPTKRTSNTNITSYTEPSLQLQFHPVRRPTRMRRWNTGVATPLLSLSFPLLKLLSVTWSAYVAQGCRKSRGMYCHFLIEATISFSLSTAAYNGLEIYKTCLEIKRRNTWFLVGACMRTNMRSVLNRTYTEQIWNKHNRTRNISLPEHKRKKNLEKWTKSQR